jgi:indolepyruvate decarboxylase
VSTQFTVAAYLKQRLEEAGLDRVFGVAGNYVAPFLDTILADARSPIRVTGVPNEIIAGYAADGYARLKGIGAVTVTYGVGAFSLLNAIAGAQVEKAPVVVINGAPSNKEFQNALYSGLLYSHMTSDPFSNLDVYRRITVNAERIVSAGAAPFQIDSALMACRTHGEPVYLEVLEDVWRAPCRPPSGPLKPGQIDISRSEVDDAVNATLDTIQKRGKPLFWAGVELQRQALQAEFLKLIDKTGFSFTTSLLGKSVVGEDHPKFLGVYSPSSPTEMKKLVGGAGCLVGLGAWTTGKDVNNQLILADNVVLAARGGVMAGPRFFSSVRLRDFLAGLLAAMEERTLKVEAYAPRRTAIYPLAATKVEVPGLTYDRFFARIDQWLQERDDLVVISDAGFPLIGAQELHIKHANGFVAQAAWLAIGYSTPAAIGVKCAMPGKRAIVIVGDGAFQETCQAVSAFSNLGHDTVVFVLANGIYGIEQKLVNPNPFRRPPVAYPDQRLNDVYVYNQLHEWAYEKLPLAFGGEGRLVDSAETLDRLLREIDACPTGTFVVNVKLPRTDTPGLLQSGLAAPGEDEILHQQWPPSLIF